MIEITCYELKYPMAGWNYFGGGNDPEMMLYSEYFWTKEEAEKRRHKIMNQYRTQCPYPEWWAKKYAYEDELATIEKIVKQI